MLPRIKGVRYIRDYLLKVTFSDGIKAELDFEGRIVGRGGVFLPLEDKDYFSKVKVDAEVGALVWPNGVDFCPDVLYSEATGESLPALETA